MDAFLETFLQQFQYLKIQLEDVKKATNNFNDKPIGVGGFGNVYKGEVSHSDGRGMVAIKRLCLDPRHGQGTPEFLKEITTLSRYRHENLITLLGFCFEAHEMILVYEHASHGSLDRYLKSPDLTWRRRIKICIDAAKGLSYLHDPRETHQRLIHCDIKSANILLDDQWKAKVADLGLSIMGSANEQNSVIVTTAAGTAGYVDPQYQMTHTLTKESDVYSFGVVLFEVLCGTFCCTYNNGLVQQNCVPTWIEAYEEKNLNDIIFKDTSIQPLDQSALEIFSNIAYRCLKKSRKDRPKMDEVVTELETALESQEFSERKPLFDYKELTKTAEPPLNYSSNGELRKLLYKGVLLDGGKTWFSLNKKGEHCEMISFADCLDSGPTEYESGNRISRFARSPCYLSSGSVKTRVKTQFLSPGIAYTVNLVFKFMLSILKHAEKCHDHIYLKYKLPDESKHSVSYLAEEREDGWWMCELYQFTSDHKIVDLEIIFDGFYNEHTLIQAEGIEFRPLEKVEDKDGKKPISDSDPNWEEKLPTDYEEIMKWPTDSVQWTTKKEGYSIIRKGFFITYGRVERSIWFSLDKNGKKCHMISATVADIFGEQECRLPLPESRFGEAVKFDFSLLEISIERESQLLSSQTTYATYLVYKLPEDQSKFVAPMQVEDDSRSKCYIYLVCPQTPIIGPNSDENTHNPVNRPKIKGIPHQRNDGWMEVQIWEFQTTSTTKLGRKSLYMTRCEFMVGLLCGLIIEGIEFRAI